MEIRNVNHIDKLKLSVIENGHWTQYKNIEIYVNEKTILAVFPLAGKNHDFHAKFVKHGHSV